MTRKRRTVIVGIDGGLASVAALEAAVAEATLRDADLVAVICWPARVRREDGRPFRCESAEEAAEILEEVISLASVSLDKTTIERRVVAGRAGLSLVGLSYGANLVVLGSLGTGLHARGATLDHCLRFAACPVLVVPWTATTAFRPTDMDMDLHLERVDTAP